MDNRKISICLPTYNRYQMTLESFAQVIDDKRISEIIISDDASTDNSFGQLLEYYMYSDKVKSYRNQTNQDCYKNKQIAINYASNDWCILLDSDNIINKSYIDTLFAIPEWKVNTIYTPDFAKPEFDFRTFTGITLKKENIAENLYKYNNLKICLNAANYFVNREEYLLCHDSTVDPITSDSIYTCYNWLHSGNEIYVVPGLEYEHRIGHPSHYTENVHKTPQGFHQNVLNKLSQL